MRAVGRRAIAKVGKTDGFTRGLTSGLTGGCQERLSKGTHMTSSDRDWRVDPIDLQVRVRFQ